MANQLGEIIRSYRKEAKLTQKQLAEKLQKAESTVRMWELGKNTPSLETLRDIGGALDIPLGELMLEAGYIKEFREMALDNLKKPPSIPTFGEAIREAREDNYNDNYEQFTIPLSDIARQTNIPETTLEQIENGEEIELTDTQIMNISNALDVNFAYLYLLAGKGNTLFEQDILENILIRTRTFSASEVKKISSMTFEEFCESEKGLINSDGSVLEMDTAGKIYNECTYSNEINQLMHLHAFPQMWSDSPDILYLLDVSHAQLNYRDRKLSANDKLKILAKIEEIADEFEYQD
ncbi:helix-turn-helix domain-containing protein [Domibacillus mangrovi]|uniref:HTH cro/C1-type domain-containing protein n=1 Tax=Domibacillus mangrovi TaxID=1714354 RepID=A0A1Q5P1U9_9BACI|nr:helix-turn-helix transcriptional regulator [Domibacillus mangrovi]OKL36224.1 hypothetical protein BLL40_11480 [Domibacillus mangrovi]